jgi:hypothetical protein
VGGSKMKKKDKIWAPPSCREYAKSKGVEIVGKLKMHWEGYGFNGKQRVYVDEAGTKYYPDLDYPTLVLPNGTIK